MSLGKLLIAGKSIFSGRGIKSYRENKRVYLPKFNSAGNPFVARPEPAAAPKAPEAKKAAAPAMAVARKVPATSASVSGAGWTNRFNPFRGTPPAAATVQKAVQPELSLETVKVVKNDLSDADIEVVPAKSRCAVPSSLVEPPMLQPSTRPWEAEGDRMNDRVMENA